MYVRPCVRLPKSLFAASIAAGSLNKSIAVAASVFAAIGMASRPAVAAFTVACQLSV